jgi:RNA polymerase sigma factor (sigma-70 family)
MKFPTTRRSAVAAVQSADLEERTRAFDVLVATYWKPLYKYVRLKWNAGPDDAQDLTQGFFTRALEKEFFRGYDAAKGSFRTWLRTCADGYVANERKAAARLKRGGGSRLLPLDFETAEGELREHPIAEGTSLEEYFHQEWVRSVFALAVEDLRRTCDAHGKHAQFRIFEQYDLEPEHGVSYAQLSEESGVPVTQVTNYLAWARREFRKLVLERLRELTATDREFRAEARTVLGISPK